jgi:hypothetical protein
MTQIKRLSTIIIWYGLTIYALLTIAFTEYAMVDSHYINVALILVATIAYFFGQPIGQLTTLLMLAIGFFGRGTVVVTVYYFKMFGLTVYWPYLLIIILFIAINHKDLPNWFAKVFSDSQTSDSSDKKENVS